MFGARLVDADTHPVLWPGQLYAQVSDLLGPDVDLPAGQWPRHVVEVQRRLERDVPDVVIDVVAYTSDLVGGTSHSHTGFDSCRELWQVLRSFRRKRDLTAPLVAGMNGRMLFDSREPSRYQFWEGVLAPALAAARPDLAGSGQSNWLDAVWVPAAADWMFETSQVVAVPVSGLFAWYDSVVVPASSAATFCARTAAANLVPAHAGDVERFVFDRMATLCWRRQVVVAAAVFVECLAGHGRVEVKSRLAAVERAVSQAECASDAVVESVVGLMSAGAEFSDAWAASELLVAA